MEDLNDQVTEAHGRLLVHRRRQESLNSVDYLLSVHHLKHLLAAEENKVLERSSSVQ